MKVWFKRVLISLVLVFIIALISIAIFLLTFDPNAYKDKLEEVVYNRYQRTLAIKGDIELSLFPRIGLSVQDLWLSNRNSADSFASIDSARLAVAIWPLMFNKLVVDHVAVTGFKAWITRDQEGEFNFNDLVERTPQIAAYPLAPAGVMAMLPWPISSAMAQSPQSSVPQAARSADFQIDIAGLDLQNGEIHFYDSITGAVARIVQLNVNTGRMTFDQAFDVSLKGKIKGDYPLADANLDAQALVRYNPEQKAYSAQKLNLQMAGQFGELKAKSATLRGNLAYSAYSQMFSASNLEVLVQGDVGGSKPISNLQTSLVVPQLKIDRSQAELQVEKLAYRATGNWPDEAFDVAFDAPGLAISPETAKGQAITGTVKLSSKSQTLGLALSLSGVGGNARDLTFKEVKVDGGLKEGNRLVQLNMTSPANWNFFQENGRLSAMKGDIRIEDEALPGGSFQFPFIGSLQTDLIKDELTSEINAVLSGSKLGFRVKAIRLKDPKVDFDLTADKLDFNTLFPPVPSQEVVAPAPLTDGKATEKAAPKPTPAKPAKTAPPTPAETMDLAFLDSVDVSGKVTIGDLKVQRVQAQNFSAAVRAAEGKLAITGIKADLYEGKLDGAIRADSKNVIATDLSLSNVALEPMLNDLGQENRLAGKGNVKVNLKSQGMTSAALEAGLTGTAQLKIRDGAVKGINVAQTLREVNAVVRNVFSGQLPNVVSQFDAGRQTDFASLDTDIDFNNGQGTIKKLSMVSPLLRISQGVPASLDLVNNQVDLVVNVRLVNTSTGQDGKDLADLKNVTVPVRISGPFRTPAYQVQWKEISSKAVKQAVQEGLMDLLSNKANRTVDEPDVPVSDTKPVDPVKSIGDALKGLLGQ